MRSKARERQPILAEHDVDLQIKNVKLDVALIINASTSINLIKKYWD